MKTTPKLPPDLLRALQQFIEENLLSAERPLPQASAAKPAFFGTFANAPSLRMKKAAPRMDAGAAAAAEAYAQAEDAGAPELLDGGWQAPESAEAMDAMPQEAATAYAKALEGFVGNNLTPVALLGTQLVAGTNYAFLCHSSLVTLDPVVSMQVVVIYADLSGNATITNIVTVNPADFN